MKTRRRELVAVAAFVFIQLAAPLLIGEIYPFTVSPMFSDCPQCYATYSVTDSSGRPLDSALFGLHLVYDGNPPGFGVGIRPRPTLHEFGEVPGRETVCGHVRKVLLSDPLLPESVIVTQKTVRPAGQGLVEEEQSWQVGRASE